ncbi:metal dependent phosphohydrolase [Nitratidesulfovibrio vulgaris DP4]|uniref:Metal dependent phosphohydrolase n=2 Tax=Nitratidesulfovibrio vulgaris TaxID=881 RepID=A0A0H3A702_NITV4|nr:metal dependent phosphohydrolase [Nitratidesulfovibrio vulgaris DP4]
MHMEKRQSIKDIEANGDVRGLFLLGAATLNQARNGPFWRLELRDATGTMEAKIWSPQSQAYPDLAPGQIVDLEGRSGTYRDRVEVTVERLRTLDEAEQASLDISQFLPASERPAAEMLEELERLCREVFTHAPWRKFVLGVLRDDDVRPRLLVAPAAKAVHHAFVGGLVEHILSVTRLCLHLAEHYPELDRQALVAGAIFHDIGKVWELTGGLANDYSDEGRLLGHIHIGLERIEPHLRKSGLEPELVMHFKHLILSHHGELEYGSPKRPKTAEAMVLHYADNIDAKMAQMRGLFANMGEGETGWSPYQNTLQRFLYRPARTPESVATTRRRRGTPEVEQCSLLSKA